MEKEKAKAYDKAIEIARSKTKNNKDHVLYEDDVIEMFPELRESEDEKMWKFIKKYAHCNISDMALDADHITRKQLESWLKKQEELVNSLSKGLDNAHERIDELIQKNNKLCIKLEKQDKQNPAEKVEPKFKVGDYIERKDGLGCHAKIIFVGENVYGCEKLIYSEDSSPFFELMFKNQDEFRMSSDFQRKSVDKIEPKFEVGDWIVSDYNVVYIESINEENYYLRLKSGYHEKMSISYVDRNWHLWTIQDAKDGDVLFHSDSASNGIFIFKEIIDRGFTKEIICYCDYDSEDHFCLGEHHTCCWADAKIIHPATKEQCDLLFKKTKEARYMWDSESKQLLSLKIELCDKQNSADLEEFINELSKQFPDVSFAKLSRITVRVAKWAKPTDKEMKELLRTEYEKGRADTIAEMKKPAWSEDDKAYMQTTVAYLKDAKEFKEYAESCITWLKSLRQRIGWKPSNEQIKALHDLNLTGNISYTGQGQTLIELYNDLKKLTE